MEQNNETPNLEFQEEESVQSSQYLQSQTPKIIQWIIKYSDGLIKDEKQANYVLIAIIGILFVVSFFIFGSALKTSELSQEKIPEELLYDQQTQNYK